MSKQETVTFDAWRKAKAAKDYQAYAPELSKMIELKKEAAQILMDVKGMKTPYDALLDSYEPGITAEKIDSGLLRYEGRSGQDRQKGRIVGGEAR